MKTRPGMIEQVIQIPRVLTFLGTVFLVLPAAPAFGSPLFVAVEAEPNGTPATANALDLGSGRALATGSIDEGGDADYWKITVPANARIWALVDTGGDSHLTLLDQNGTTILEEDEDDGAGNGGDLYVESLLASVIAGRQAGAAGTYFLRVTESTGEALSRYALSVVVASTATLESEPNDSLASATPLVTATSPIAARNAAIAETSWDDFEDDDLDYYSIAANVGDTIFVSADGDPDRDGVQTELGFEILDATGKELLSVDFHSDGPSIYGSGFIGEGATLTVATTPVYVRARGSDPTAAGTYRIVAASHHFPPPATVFYTVPPCRIADTRTGYPGPLTANVAETFYIGGKCGIPATAKAVSFNFTVIDATANGAITVWAGNQPKPATTAVAAAVGKTRSNNAVIPLSSEGFAAIQAEGALPAGTTFHFVIDVNGYFIEDAF